MVTATTSIDKDGATRVAVNGEEQTPQHKVNSISDDPNKDGNRSDDPNNASSSTERLWESAVSVFAPCVGAVDFASIFMQSSCKPDSTDHRGQPEPKPVLNMKLKKLPPRGRKRQGETLEFPVNGGFDDDVSAISAQTLEEMERLEKLSRSMNLSGAPRTGEVKNGSIAPSQARSRIDQVKPLPSSKKVSELDWTYQVSRKTSNTSLSLGVSTSGSASSGEGDQPHQGEQLQLRGEV